MAATDIVSLATAIAPARSRFRALIAEVAAWALASGTSISPDGLALVLAAVDESFDDLSAPWTRPRVNRLIMCDVFNWCSRHRVFVTEESPELVWHFLDFLAASGRMAPGSDSLDRLREPLMCYGELDGEGLRRPPGQPASFPCECYLEVVAPKIPGRTRWRTCAGVMLEMWRPAPDEPELAIWWQALVRFARRARQEQVPWPAHVDEFQLVGNISSTRGRPLLWVYVHDRSRGELFLDDDGEAFLAHPDPRTKVGARFTACDERRATYAAGLPAVVAPVWYEPPGGGLQDVTEPAVVQLR